jgi:hypothetical protein
VDHRATEQHSPLVSDYELDVSNINQFWTPFLLSQSLKKEDETNTSWKDDREERMEQVWTEFT